MESTGKKKPRPRRSFTAEFKAEIVELIHRRTWPIREVASSANFDYIEGWYNHDHHHSTLGYLSPATFESTRATTLEQVA